MCCQIRALKSAEEDKNFMRQLDIVEGELSNFY